MIIDYKSKEVNLTTDIESIGDGQFLYESKRGTTVASAEDILQFTTRGEYQGKYFDQYCNDINVLIDKIWKCRYNPTYHKYIAKWFHCTPTLLDKSKGKGWEEKFTNYQTFRTMKGYVPPMVIGSEGTIIIGSAVCRVEWDKHLSSSSFSTIILNTDAFKYIVTYQDDKGKPSKGFSKMANYISNYISAFPNGISSRDIECGLKLGHPTVAGRISEMDNAGRITKIGGIKYCSKGKENSIWVISKE